MSQIVYIVIIRLLQVTEYNSITIPTKQLPHVKATIKGLSSRGTRHDQFHENDPVARSLSADIRFWGSRNTINFAVVLLEADRDDTGAVRSIPESRGVCDEAWNLHLTLEDQVHPS